jgi:hypothetical protein
VVENFPTQRLHQMGEIPLPMMKPFNISQKVRQHSQASAICTLHATIR